MRSDRPGSHRPLSIFWASSRADPLTLRGSCLGPLLSLSVGEREGAPCDSMRRSKWQCLPRASELWGRGLAEVLDGAAGGWVARTDILERRFWCWVSGPRAGSISRWRCWLCSGRCRGVAVIRRGWARSRTGSARRGVGRGAVGRYAYMPVNSRQYQTKVITPASVYVGIILLALGLLAAAFDGG